MTEKPQKDLKDIKLKIIDQSKNSVKVWYSYKVAGKEISATFISNNLKKYTLEADPSIIKEILLAEARAAIMSTSYTGLEFEYDKGDKHIKATIVGHKGNVIAIEFTITIANNTADALSISHSMRAAIRKGLTVEELRIVVDKIITEAMSTLSLVGLEINGTVNLSPVKPIKATEVNKNCTEQPSKE